MWWFNPRRTARLVALLALAGLTAGCFQPLYGDKTVAGSPAIADRMSSVERGYRSTRPTARGWRASASRCATTCCSV